MSFLLDTCVISEWTRPRPDPAVDSWIASQPASRLYMSALSLGELSFGIGRLPSGRKRERLEDWLQNVLRPFFEDRWLPFDESVAERWGELRVDGFRRGRPLPMVDSMIGATAIHHGMTLVSRNESDFAPAGLRIFNPWST